MELTDKELELVARSRVSRPYKTRIYIASAVAVGVIISSGIPAGTHIWQIVLIPVVATMYFTYAIWQGRALDIASQRQLKEWLSEIGDKPKPV